MLRAIVVLLALAGAFVLTAMLVAPSYPDMRDWYLVNACPQLDKLSPDICGAIRRSASGGSADAGSATARFATIRVAEARR